MPSAVRSTSGLGLQRGQARQERGGVLAQLLAILPQLGKLLLQDFDPARPSALHGLLQGMGW
jgi:hypothetical protein